MPVVYSADGDPAAPAGGGANKLGPVAAIVLVVIAAGLVGWRFRQARQATPEPAPMTAGGGAGMAPGGGGAGMAPGGGGAGGQGGGQRMGSMEQMAEELELTEEQKAQMAEAGAIGPKMAAVREDASLTDEQRREKYREILDEQQAAFAKILTPEQQKKYEELQAARRSQGGGQGGGQGGPGGQGGRQGWMTRLAEQLELTAEQQPKWDKVREDYEAKRQALREDTALSDEDRRTKMTQLREQQNKELKTILTPEQQKKMDETIAERAQNFGGGGQGGGGERGGGGGPGGGGGGGEQAAPAPSQT